MSIYLRRRENRDTSFTPATQVRESAYGACRGPISSVEDSVPARGATIVTSSACGANKPSHGRNGRPPDLALRHDEACFADGLRYIRQAELIDQGAWRDGLLYSIDHPLHPLGIVLARGLVGGDGPVAWQRRPSG